MARDWEWIDWSDAEWTDTQDAEWLPPGGALVLDESLTETLSFSVARYSQALYRIKTQEDLSFKHSAAFGQILNALIYQEVSLNDVKHFRQILNAEIAERLKAAEAVGGEIAEEYVGAAWNWIDWSNAEWIDTQDAEWLDRGAEEAGVHDVSLSETVTMEIPQGFNTIMAVEKLEQMSLDELMQLRAVMSSIIEDALSLDDIEAYQFKFAFATDEQIALSKILTAYATYGVSLDEVLTLAYSILYGAADVWNESLKARLSVAETQFSTALQLYALVSEDMSMGIQAVANLAYVVSVAEDVSIIEHDAARTVINVKVSESAKMADVCRAIFAFGLSLTDNLTAGSIQTGYRIAPVIEIRRGHAYVFSIDRVKAEVEVRPNVQGLQRRG